MTTPTKVSRMVGIVCPDKFGIHKGSPDGVYVRYALLYDQNGGMTWIDNPNIFDLQGIIFDCSIETTWVESNCPWCNARASSS